MHTTNYFNTFIEVAPDTKVTRGIPPTAKGKRTVAQIQFEIIAGNPYKFTSDDVLFQVYAERNNVNSNLKQARELFFSKGQPCFRASPIPKQFGFGIHFNESGKMALCPMESDEYRQFVNDSALTKLRAMRSSRK